MKKCISIVFLVFSMALVIGCDLLQGQGDEDMLEHQPDSTLADYIRITALQAQEMMLEEDINYVVVDVRSSGEFEQSHIPGAILLTYTDLPDTAARALRDRNQVIFIYCGIGVRSEIAARTLITLGYTRVYDMGGIVDWPGDLVVGG